jgi:serine/threonine-protein kinase
MSQPQLIEPRLDTPAPNASEKTSHPLPEALLSEQIHRLAICAAVGAGLWAYGLVMDTMVRPFAMGVPVARFSVGVEIGAIVGSLLMFAYVRYVPHALDRKTEAGLLYFVVNAAAVALINAQTGLASVETGRGLSWNAVVILVAAMILPAAPRQMLAASMIAAAMDPLVVWTAQLREASSSFAHILVFYMPNFACGVVATLPSRVLHRIGRRLRQAQELGSYQLVELLGRGGMGEVWRARHRMLARRAAIKLIRPELLGAGGEAETRSMLRRFEHEAQATAALSSPHTIRVFDFGATADHTFYYVMELLEGRDLQSFVREFGPVPAGRALFLLHQASHSLAEAHARGLVHRDITPSNIYICRMGLDYDFIKVLDFGLVTFNGRQSLDAPTAGRTHKTAGTPAFMAPEIVFGAEVDQRADVYALGCVAYYLLTGQPVFEADNPSDLFALHLEAPPVPPSQRTELPIPRELDALVLACLEKDPGRRPQDAGAVLAMLRRCQSADGWNNDQARIWWERHLVELADPLEATGAIALESALMAR